MSKPHTYCVPAARPVGDDNDAFGLDYAELSALQARQLLRRASCTSASAAIALEPAYQDYDAIGGMPPPHRAD